ncbi:alpha/beta hydrolase fold domain-containing protein [Salipiger mucosus]|uniref:6-hexanolactone hydrolase n=1 Tax=Salipiger mucosus DSM 16094 TaxID=1123237 RepID=S9Q5R8_9RHOB|nr:alpha/beta hydrolase fold domain-containing protein [Salipiger mucosus]EPX76711.1 6-hexanolactone hydrolase [Salipiger mucosus DSM 16094]
MSWQLACLNAGLRLIAKPKLRLTPGPEAAEREFRRTAALALRHPPYLRHVVRPGGLHWISAGSCAPGRVILYFHGGGYVSGSPETHAGLMGRLSKLSGVEVCAPRYPMAQLAPAPAQFDSAVAAWAALARLGYRPGDVVLAGDSAGGGLALALLAHLCAAGTPPAGALAFSPWTDLAMTGESLVRNRRADPFLPVERIEELVEVVLGGTDARDPRISPLYGAFPGCPPVLIQYAGTEILADDARRMAARLRDFGAEVTEDVHPGAPHAWQCFDGWIPEARAALRRAAGFVQTSLAATSR